MNRRLLFHAIKTLEDAMMMLIEQHGDVALPIDPYVYTIANIAVLRLQTCPRSRRPVTFSLLKQAAQGLMILLIERHNNFEVSFNIRQNGKRIGSGTISKV